MTAFEKQKQVKDVLQCMCIYDSMGCPSCRFFHPDDDTDGEYFCAIRDYKGNLPCDGDCWNMESAMTKE